MIEEKGATLEMTNLMSLEVVFVVLLCFAIYRYLKLEEYFLGKWRVAYWLFVFMFVLVAFGRRAC